MDYTIWIPTIIGLISVLITVGVYFSTKKGKDLYCEIHPSISLDFERKFGEKIKVLYEDRPTNNVSMRQITLRNTGKGPIKRADIERPISFKFDEDTKLVKWEVINAKPDDIETKIDYDSKENKVELEFDLLNEGDEITLQFTSLGDKIKTPKISSGIAGVKEIRTFRRPKKEESADFLGHLYIGIGITLFLIALFGFLLKLISEADMITFSILGGGIFILGFGIRLGVKIGVKG